MDRSHLDYALNLHHELPATGNLVWSPYSVASALGIAAAGARGRTYDELAAVLAPGSSLEGTAALLADASNVTDADIAVANSLWMREGLTFHEAYQQKVLSWPGGGLRVADFKHDPEGSRRKINSEVEEVTRGLITELVPSGAIHALTTAAIVNALYLKAAWNNPFSEGATSLGAFHGPDGTRDVPMMRLEERLRYAAAAGWRMVTLPAEGRLAVDVLLPDTDERSGSESAALTVEILMALHEAATSRKVDVALPKFRIEADCLLGDALVQLGVVNAFGDGADFSGVSDETFAIDQVLHKAVLDVDEQGFEGAAATAVMMKLTSLDTATPIRFHVDRPFHVLVRHRTGAIFFIARVEHP
jgi:serpin B